MADMPVPIPDDSAVESSQILRDQTARQFDNYKRLVARTVETFGDEIRASRWLSQPSPDFKGKCPLEVAQNAGYDPQILEPILVRIEHGIYY